MLLFEATGAIRILAVLAGLGIMSFRASANPPESGELTQQQRNGKRIFFRGESNAHTPILASLGDPPMQVSAQILPCVNCHGFDGHGQSEAGVQTSNISWSALTKPYGTTLPTGRRRSAYSETTLKRAISKGIDSSSNKLGVGMPKFQMSDADMTSLIAYIKRIESDFDPGVTDTEIVVAMVWPQNDTRKLSAEAAGDLLRARFKQVNENGGVYGRIIKLRVFGVTGKPAASIVSLRHFLKTESVFALITPFVPGASAELAALAGEREIPIIVPLAGPPLAVDESNRFVFYLHSGLDTQACVLVDDLVQQNQSVERSTYAVLSERQEPFEGLARVVKDRFETHGVRNITITIDDHTQTSRERINRLLHEADGVFLLGSDAQVNTWVTQASTISVSPKLLLLSASLGEQSFSAMKSYAGHLVAAFPNSSNAQSPAARSAFRTFLDQHGLATTLDTATLAANCAADLFLEGLKNAGRKLRRELLIRELEGLYEFSTGLTHEVTYGPTRRVGVRGAYVVTFDPTTTISHPNSRWVEFPD